LLMLTSYGPGVTSTKMYRPASLLVAVRELLVATSVSVTVAPATTAPDGSVTVPATVPVDVDCAQAAGALLKQSIAKQKRKQANREEKIWRRTRIAKPSRTKSDGREDAANCVSPTALLRDHCFLLRDPGDVGVQRMFTLAPISADRSGHYHY
jgi:hypothetical protein